MQNDGDNHRRHGYYHCKERAYRVHAADEFSRVLVAGHAGVNGLN
jgi:hypothetical protein